MLKDIHAVLFDLDGTLVDSMWMWREIDIEFLGERNLPLLPELQQEIEGLSFVETAVYFKEKFNLSESLKEIETIWLDMARDKYCFEVPLKPGAKQFLMYLKEHAIKMGIASSNNMDLVKAVLNSHGVAHYFDSIHTCCEVPKGKPSPDIYLLVADDLSVNPENCLVCEDIVNGLWAGKHAGMRTCAVEDDYSAYQREEKKKLADFYIQDYMELTARLKEESSYE